MDSAVAETMRGGMLPVHGPAKTLVEQKIRRRALLADLDALALFEFFQFVRRKTGTE